MTPVDNDKDTQKDKDKDRRKLLTRKCSCTYMGIVTLCCDKSLKTNRHIRLPLTKPMTKTKLKRLKTQHPFPCLCHDQISIMVGAYILLKIYECLKLPFSFLRRTVYILPNRPKFEPQ